MSTTGGFSFPVVGVSAHDLADNYGAPRSGGRKHRGIDIFADKGTTVVAVRGGTVVKQGDPGGLSGLRVWIKDDQGYFHFYAHLNSINVQAGQRVATGQKIGTVGNTGLEAVHTPDHLHYSVNHVGHTAESPGINPYEYLMSNGAVAAVEDIYTDRATDVQGRMRRIEAGQEDPGQRAVYSDPDQQFVADRRTSSDTMASIMSFISDATRGEGGRILDTAALFGDLFSDGSADEHDHASQAGETLSRR